MVIVIDPAIAKSEPFQEYILCHGHCHGAVLEEGCFKLTDMIMIRHVHSILFYILHMLQSEILGP